MHTAVTTELLGEHPSLLEISIPGMSPITSWVRGGDGLVGFGVYKSHIVKGPQRFHQARQWWREQVNSLDIHNNLHGTGTGQESSLHRSLSTRRRIQYCLFQRS